MSKLNVNMLTWHTRRVHQDSQRFWVYEVEPVVSGFDRIPPFQLSREKTGFPVNSLKLINYRTRAETDILSLFQAAGGEIVETDNYDVIRYPDTVPLGITGIELGFYELEMSDGVNTWYSEIFQMCPGLDGYIKIEYWHREKFCFPGGEFVYDAPYKSRAWIASDIAKPSYPYEEVVEKNRGYVFPTMQISYKLFRFSVLLTEYMIDAMRLVGLHDNVEIYYNEQKYVVDEFLMTDPVWEEQGDVAEVVFEFKTDTVVSIGGRAVDVQPYEPAAGVCVRNRYNCVGIVDAGSELNNNDQYLGSDGNPKDLLDNDFVLIRQNAFDIRVYLYNAGSYSIQAIDAGQVAFSEANNTYYTGIGGNSVLPAQLYSYDNNSQQLSGVFLPDANHLLYAVSGGVESYIGSYTYDELAIAGVSVQVPEGAEFVRMVMSSAACGIFQTTSDLELVAGTVGQGIGEDIIGETLIVY